MIQTERFWVLCGFKICTFIQIISLVLYHINFKMTDRFQGYGPQLNFDDFLVRFKVFGILMTIYDFVDVKKSCFQSGLFFMNKTFLVGSSDSSVGSFVVVVPLDFG